MAAGAGLYVSGISSSSASMTRAEAILAKVKSHNIRSPESIISCLHFNQGRTVETPPDLHKRFGDKYFEYFDCCTSIERFRSIYMASSRYFSTEEKPFCGECVSVAIALYEGVGACGELSYLTDLYAKEEHLHSAILMLGGDKERKPDGTIIENSHALVIVSDKPMDATALKAAAKKGGARFVETMRHLPDYVVIDPYLGKISKAKEVDRDPDFINKLKAISTLSLNSLEPHIHSPDETRKGITPLEGLSLDITSVHKSVLTMKGAKIPKAPWEIYIRSQRIDLIKTQLENLYKSTGKVWERKEDQLVFKCSEKERDSVFDALKGFEVILNDSKGFGVVLMRGKITSTGEFALVIIFTNASYEDVRFFHEKVMGLK